MTTTPVRVDREQGATFVELFFDLVFVYAVTQLTGFVLHDLTWSGVGHGLVLFWLVWWSWTQFTWTLNEADTEHVWIRLPTLLATAVAFFLAQAIPDAYGDAGLWFAGSYVLARGIGLGVQWWVFRDDDVQLPALRRWIGASGVGVVLVLVGGLLDGDARTILWVAAILSDLLAATVAGRGIWQLEAGHFVERHGLIVIIALGESLIAAGVASADVERTATFAIATAGAVVGACALWWTYFGVLHDALEQRMAAEPEASRGAFARDVFSFGHAMVVAGVIGVAVGFEEAIAHPADPFHTEVAVAFAVGTALFLLGAVAGAARSGLTWAVGPRVALAVIAVGSIPFMTGVDAAWAVWGLAVGAIAIGLYEGPDGVRAPEPPEVAA